MTRMRRIMVAGLGAGILIGCGLFASAAGADYVVTLEQQGGNVVAFGSGTIDTTGLRSRGSNLGFAHIAPAGGEIGTGPASGPQPADAFSGFTGPPSFGSGDDTSADSGSGDIVAISAGLNFLFVPQGYVSGDRLVDTSEYNDATYSTLGVTPGTYIATWGSGPDADSFTLDILPAPGTTEVPEPSTLMLLALPLGFVLMLSVRPRQNRRSAA
jgi:hypothetical protein